MVSISVMHLIAWITTHLSTPEGWKAELPGWLTNSGGSEWEEFNAPPDTELYSLTTTTWSPVNHRSGAGQESPKFIVVVFKWENRDWRTFGTLRGSSGFKRLGNDLWKPTYGEKHRSMDCLEVRPQPARDEFLYRTQHNLISKSHKSTQ